MFVPTVPPPPENKLFYNGIRPLRKFSVQMQTPIKLYKPLRKKRRFRLDEDYLTRL